MIFSIRRSFFRPKNCHCSQIVTLTGVTISRQACSHLAVVSSSLYVQSSTFSIHGEKTKLKLSVCLLRYKGDIWRFYKESDRCSDTRGNLRLSHSLIPMAKEPILALK